MMYKQGNMLSDDQFMSFMQLNFQEQYKIGTILKNSAHSAMFTNLVFMSDERFATALMYKGNNYFTEQEVDILLYMLLSDKKAQKIIYNEVRRRTYEQYKTLQLDKVAKGIRKTFKTLDDSGVFQLMDDYGNATMTSDPIPDGTFTSAIGPYGMFVDKSDNAFGVTLALTGKGGRKFTNFLMKTKLVGSYSDDVMRYGDDVLEGLSKGALSIGAKSIYDVNYDSIIRALRQSGSPEGYATSKLIKRGKVNMKILDNIDEYKLLYKDRNIYPKNTLGIKSYYSDDIFIFKDYAKNPMQAAGGVAHETKHWLQKLTPLKYKQNKLLFEREAYNWTLAVDKNITKTMVEDLLIKYYLK